MQRGGRGKIVGIIGIITLLNSWAAIWFAPFLLPPQWVPRVWILVLIALPCAIGLGIVAARLSSKWWYFLAGAGFFTAVALLAGAAV